MEDCGYDRRVRLGLKGNMGGNCKTALSFREYKYVRVDLKVDRRVNEEIKQDYLLGGNVY